MLKVCAITLFAATAAGYSMPASRVVTSRVARPQRVVDVQMGKKSVSDLTDAELKGKRVLIQGGYPAR